MKPRVHITSAELNVIDSIVNRALSIFPDRDRSHVKMDILTTHIGACTLDLNRFLDADDFNFIHDVIGIERHLNRRTFELEDCFVPRFASFQHKKNPAT
jgi:hypothetical protein